jgi:hypothetical protein
MPSSAAITPTTKPPPKQAPTVIVGDNCCSNFIYNIPRAAVLVTLSGFTILLIGAVLVSVADRSQGWYDGAALIAFIFLILGGAWTVGAVIFWVVNYCQIRPKGPRPNKKAVTSDIVSASPEVTSLELVSVHKHPASENPSPATSSVNLSAQTDQIQIFTVS